MRMGALQATVRDVTAGYTSTMLTNLLKYINYVLYYISDYMADVLYVRCRLIPAIKSADI
jgi:hypothetical protein